MERTLQIVILLCFVFSSVADVHVGLENRISSDVKDYINGIASAIAKKYDRDIQDLKAIIDSQERKIQHLESKNHVYSADIHEQQKRKEAIETKADDTKNIGYNQRITFDGPTENNIPKNDETGAKDRKRVAGKEIPFQMNSSIGRSRRANVENKVAFFAAMTSNAEHLGANQDIVFDNAVTNVGNAYNANHGTFVAPTAGTYVFAVTLFHISSQGTPGSWGRVMVNGKKVANLHVNLEQSSQTIVVNLKVGDDVSVQNTHTDRGFYGSYYSTFSGFLLYEDFSAAPIVG